MTDVAQDAGPDALKRLARHVGARLATLCPADRVPDRPTVGTVLAALLDGAVVVEEFGVRWFTTADQGEWDDFGFLNEAQARSEIDGDGVLLCRRTLILPVEEVAP